MSALKYDQTKLPLSWVPKVLKEGIAAVLKYGAAKYTRDNWRKGLEWSRLVDSTMRHLECWNACEDLDRETKMSHLAHAATNIAFLMEYQDKQLGTDDRFRYISARRAHMPTAKAKKEKLPSTDKKTMKSLKKGTEKSEGLGRNQEFLVGTYKSKSPDERKVPGKKKAKKKKVSK